MKTFDKNHVKNVVLLGHTGSGKTSLAETFLFHAGVISRKGSVEEGNTVADYTDIEHEKGRTLFTKLMNVDWKGYKINVLDTPGSDDLSGEILSAMKVADCGVMVLNAAMGVEVGSDMFWHYTEETKFPVLFVVNQIDHEKADFEATVQQAKEHFGPQVVVVQYPLAHGEKGFDIIDVLHMCMYRYDGQGGAPEKLPIPEVTLDKAKQLHQELIETIATYDETLMEKFFAEGTLSETEMKQGLHHALDRHELFPVFCASAKSTIGTERLMDFIDQICPSAHELPPYKTVDGKGVVCDENKPTAIFIFKTIHEPHVGELSFFKVISGVIHAGDELTNENTGQTEKINQLFETEGRQRIPVQQLMAGDIGATLKLKDTHTNNTLHAKGFPVELQPIVYPEPTYTLAVEATVKGEEERLSQALHQLVEEDPSLRIEVSPELKQTLLHTTGELHMNVIQWKLINVFKLHVDFKTPRIPFRETITRAASTVYRHKKQTGGAGQFAEVSMIIEPWTPGMAEPQGISIRGKEEVDLPWGGKLVYYNAVVGGAIDTRFHSSILKGIMEKMTEGPLYGAYVRDIRVIVNDGKMHAVDSNDLAFKTAGMMAFKENFLNAAPQLMEPMQRVVITAPEEVTGSVMGGIQTHRAMIEGMDSEGHFTLITAIIPKAELHAFAGDLKSLSQGRAKFTMEFSHYQPISFEWQQELIREVKHELLDV